ncbi:MAG: ABC transporter substrate-binding protein [Leptolyngbyaceae cyanobacterium bins.302]|nr:ABC transporter substrate-binding protein [Leptolyngbyaceae cyanobacterium bins.302]
MLYFEVLKQFFTRLLTRWRSLRYCILGVVCFFSIILVSWVVMAQSRPVVLRMLVPAPDSPPLTAIVKAFEQQNPDIRVELVEGPNATNLVEDLYTSAFLLGDSPYDLVNLDVVWTPKFAAAGWLMDLSDRVTAADLAKYSPVDVEGSRYEGKLYRLPMRSDVGLLYYRKDLLEEAGFQPPETFDDLMKISKALQQQGKVPWGYVWQGRQYEGAVAMFVEVLKGYGGFWINPQTKEVGLDRPETLQALNFLRSTIKEKVSPPGVSTYVEEDTRRIFQSGQAAFLRSWPYVWTLANAEASKLRGKVGVQAMVHAAGEDAGACLGGWGLGISKTTTHTKEAWKAVQFFSSAEPLRNFILKEGYTPSIRQFFNDPEMVAKYSHFPQMQEAVDNAVLRPPIAQYAQASDILQRYLSAALTDRISPEDAMQRAAGETRRLLGVEG